MSRNIKLNEGCLEVIMGGGEVDCPQVQVLGSKKIHSANASKDRYRILLSDGKNSISYAMYTVSINDTSVAEGVAEFSVIKLNKYITSIIDNAGKGKTRVLLILKAEVVVPGSQVGHVIGDPTPLADAKIATPDMQKAKPSNVSNASSSINATLGSSFGADAKHIISPISSLSPYHNKWVIKARVLNKSPIRTWSNSRGEGKLFTMDLMDESGEIRCTAFRDVVDKFYDYIQPDKIYFISKCQIKPANKQFSTIKNDYEMTMNSETMVEECQDEDTSVPQVKYDFVPIDKIAHMEVGTLVDVIGVCKSASDLQSFTARSSGRELKKRDVVLVDQSKTAISLTLWGQQAESFEADGNPVVLVKGAKVGEFGGGKSISVMMNSQFKINPDIPESHKLKGWYDLEGSLAEITNVSTITGSGTFNTPWMALKDAQTQGFGSNEKGDYYQFVGTVLLMRSENALYKACPQAECNKKVVDLQNGMYRCEKCGQEYPDFKWRLLASMNLADWSSNQWVTSFSSEAEKILGYTSAELGEKLEQDQEAYQKCFENGNFKRYTFKCRAKMETYNDENRLKTVVVNAGPVNYEEYNKYLIERINQLLK